MTPSLRDDITRLSPVIDEVMATFVRRDLSPDDVVKVCIWLAASSLGLRDRSCNEAIEMLAQSWAFAVIHADEVG